MTERRRDTGKTALVALNNVLLQQNGTPISAPLTWRMNFGEQWAILGPMSAGKRRLAETIAGQATVYHGEIVYGDALRSAMAPSAHAAISYVTFDRRPRGAAGFHQARWHADLTTATPTVAEALSYPGVWRQNPFEVSHQQLGSEALVAFEARQERILDQFELRPLLKHRLHALSDGEWRRLQIGRALLRAPRLLILDHPFAGLDHGFRPKLSQALLELTRDEATQMLLLCSHPSDISAMITHIMVMSQGQIVAQGKREDLDNEMMIDAAGPVALSTSHRETASGAPGNQATDGPSEPKPTTTVIRRAPPAPAGRAQANHPPLISMARINVAHNGIHILHNVSWTVREGEKWALVGPNGAGKSTLLSLILGDHPQAYANDIEIFGRQRGSGESIWEIKQQIGWVAPELHRYHPPTISARDIICSGYFDTLGLHRPATAAQRHAAVQWMARLDIEVDPKTPFRRLSKGEQRLTLIARALVKNPKLLILDEPCQGLDTAHLKRVLIALEEVTCDPTRSLIYVTHHQREFPKGLTHVLALEEGHVVQRGAAFGDVAPH